MLINKRKYMSTHFLSQATAQLSLLAVSVSYIQIPQFGNFLDRCLKALARLPLKEIVQRDTCNLRKSEKTNIFGAL